MLLLYHEKLNSSISILNNINTSLMKSTNLRLLIKKKKPKPYKLSPSLM